MKLNFPLQIIKFPLNLNKDQLNYSLNNNENNENYKNYNNNNDNDESIDEHNKVRF